MSDKQQSAVDWLEEQIEKYTWYDSDGFRQCSLSIIDFHKAKELFKQQIIDARVDGMIKGIEIGDNPINYKLHETHEQYFNDKFKTESNG